MLLSREERNRFASYCELQASTEEKMIEQLRTMPLGATLEPLIKKRSAEMAAYAIVARLLRSIEEDTL